MKEYDVVFTPEACRYWNTACEPVSEGDPFSLRLLTLLIRDQGERLGIQKIDRFHKSGNNREEGNNIGISPADIARLAWSIAFPCPIDVRELWYSLVCLDATTRYRLAQLIGEESVHKIHREAARAVLGETIVNSLEDIVLSPDVPENRRQQLT
jgi:hypothetical protein